MYHPIFLKAIESKSLLQLCFNSIEKGQIVRRCIPFDFGPSNRYKDGNDRYHFYDLDSPDGKHNLSILPNQVVEITLVEETFEPGDYVKWTPKWHVARDWGAFS